MILHFADIVTLGERHTLEFDLQKKVPNITQDTRKLQPGDVYLALRGENHDGHDFVKNAFAAGAIAAIVEKNFANLPNCIYCTDPLNFLTQVAKQHREKISGTFIAIAGSNGKTSTKEFLRTLLSVRGPVSCTEGNLNNHIGVPLTLCRLRPEAFAHIVELGMNHFGELNHLTKLSRPDIALITSIGYEHVEFLGGTLEGVAKAEGELFAELATNATAIVNLDEPLIRQMPTGARRITYGFTENADVHGKIVLQKTDATVLEILGFGKKIEVSLNFVGSAIVRNALGAAAIAFALGLTPEEIKDGLSILKLPSNRGQATRLHKVLMINDTYNANPDSMRAAFEALKIRSPDSYKIAVLGGMLELGNVAESLHREVGKEAQNVFSAIFSFGEKANLYGANAPQTLITKHFENHETLAKELYALIESRKNEEIAVLFKGSRGMQMEKVLEILKAWLERKKT